MHICVAQTAFAQEDSAAARRNAMFNEKITEIAPSSETGKSGFLQVEKVQALFHGSLSVRYLPGGDIPRLLPTINSPLAFMNVGFGTTMFIDNIFLGFHTGLLRRWNISEPNNLNAELYDASYLIDASLGYTVWKQDQLVLTPSATIGVTRYSFQNQIDYTSRYLGAEMNLTYTVPIIPLRYTMPLALNSQRTSKEFVGSIDAMVSLRMGYAQHFNFRFTNTTFSEVYVRLSVGLGLTRLENP
jgi:hypothetical protein